VLGLGELRDGQRRPGEGRREGDALLQEGDDLLPVQHGEELGRGELVRVGVGGGDVGVGGDPVEAKRGGEEVQRLLDAPARDAVPLEGHARRDKGGPELLGLGCWWLGREGECVLLAAWTELIEFKQQVSS
jgi:hypothetical protein